MSNDLAPRCPIHPGQGCLLGLIGPNTWFCCHQFSIDFDTAGRRAPQRTARSAP
jgi:hypothetical protein